MLNTYTSEVSSSINNVGILVNEAVGYLKSQCENLDEDILFDLNVILNELVLNAVKHGNNQDEKKTVRLTAGIVKDSHIFFIVEDCGEGYDYQRVINEHKSILDANDVCKIKETGRGILIVSNLCDSIRFNKKGNKVVVLKKL